MILLLKEEETSEEAPLLKTDITKKRLIKPKKRDSVTEVVPEVEKDFETKVEEVIEISDTKATTGDSLVERPEEIPSEEAPLLKTDITTKKRLIKPKKRDSVTEVVPEVEKDFETKVEEVIEISDTKATTGDSLVERPEEIPSEESTLLKTDITTKKRLIKPKKRDSVTEVVPEVEKDFETKVEEVIEISDTKAPTGGSLVERPEEIPSEEAPLLKTDITTKKRLIKPKKRDSVTEVVPEVEKDFETKVEEVIEISDTKATTGDSLVERPEEIPSEEAPLLKTDITTKKRLIKPKKRDSVTEVVPEVEKDFETKVEEVIEISDTKATTGDSLVERPEEIPSEEAPLLKTDITTKKRLIKPKKRDSVTEVVPEVEKDFETKVEEVIEISDTKATTGDSLVERPEEIPSEESTLLKTDITTKKRLIKPKKRDSVTEVVPEVEKDFETKVEEVIEISDTKATTGDSLVERD